MGGKFGASKKKENSKAWRLDPVEKFSSLPPDTVHEAISFENIGDSSTANSDRHESASEAAKKSVLSCEFDCRVKSDGPVPVFTDEECWWGGREEISYDGWRLDFVRGFWGGYVKDYLDSSEPYFAVGEYWDSLNDTYGEVDHNQDAHRQSIVDWINATNGTAGAFDVTTKGILCAALERCEYWRLSEGTGRPPGVVGWWPSRAVTFIENHDTGSTQVGKKCRVMPISLPGTPSVFHDHNFSEYKYEISSLIAIKKRNNIHGSNTRGRQRCLCSHDAEKLAMKIGPGHFEPSSGSQNCVQPSKTRIIRSGKNHEKDTDSSL